jgi:hypothetical protein
MLHTAAADRDTLWVHNLQRDGEPDLHGGLRFDAACMSDKLRAAVSFAVNKYLLPTVAWFRWLMGPAS